MPLPTATDECSPWFEHSYDTRVTFEAINLPVGLRMPVTRTILAEMRGTHAPHLGGYLVLVFV